MAKSFDSIAEKLTPDAAQLSVIRQDINALKSDAAVLKDDLIQVGSEKAQKASTIAREQLQEAKKSASQKFDSAEVFVKNNPGQSVAMAFLAGALVSLFFGGRR